MFCISVILLFYIINYLSMCDLLNQDLWRSENHCPHQQWLHIRFSGETFGMLVAENSKFGEDQRPPSCKDENFSGYMRMVSKWFPNGDQELPTTDLPRVFGRQNGLQTKDWVIRTRLDGIRNCTVLFLLRW